MTSDPTSRALDALTADAADLDGHTIDELADYLDRGRIPVDPTIEESPACRRALASLVRLRTVSTTFLADAPAGAEVEDSWMQGVMGRIALEARAGADFLLLTTDDGDEVVMTEGALRSLVRVAGDALPGCLVGRVRFDGDLSDPDDTIALTIDVVVTYGTPVPALTGALRTAVAEQLARHTRFRGIVIDVVVRDVIRLRSTE